MRPTSGSAGAVSDPVFVDRSGRRGRLVKRAGVLVSLLGLAYGVALVSLALVGVHISAPGLPLLESSVRTVNGNRPAEPHRGAPRPATVTSRPKSTPTTRSATNTIRMPSARAVASAADDDTTSTRAARASRPDSQSRTHARVPADPAAVAAPAAVSPAAPSAGPSAAASPAAASPAAASSAAASTAPRTDAASPTAASPTAASPTGALSPATVSRGKSDAAPGAARRTTHVNQGKSSEAPAASDRPTDPSRGKSAEAPGASRRPTDP